MLFSDEYTEKVKDKYLDFEDIYNYEVLNKVNAEIDCISDEAAPADFREKITRIRQEYYCSARRFLMEYVKRMSTVNEDGSFDFSYEGKKYHFGGAGMEYALSLSDEERNRYITLLTKIALGNSGEEGDREALADWRRIFRIAMLWNKNPTILSREDGLKLCHGLHFSFSEARDFMVRVMENDGFNFASSDDYIEFFCFAHIGANHWRTARELKEEYQNKTRGIVRLKVEEKPEIGTRLTIQRLPDLIKVWESSINERTVEEKFMKWLVSKAGQLDQVSRSSHEVYSSLCAIAYKMSLDILENNDTDYEEENITLTDYIFKYFEEKKEIIREILTNVSSYDMQKVLVNFAVNEFDHQRITNHEEFWKSWRYLTIGSKGEITTEYIGHRIIDLLQGEKFVKKADLLFLIWLICDMYWTGRNEEFLFIDCIQDFLNLSEDMLGKAMLPDFYAPHILEQSMLMSICRMFDKNLGGDLEPFEAYQQICEAYSPRRNKRSAKSAEDNEEDPGENTKEKVTLNSLRLLWEAEIEEKFYEGKITYDGLEKELLDHFLANGKEGRAYLFDEKGISFSPDQDIVIKYPRESLASRFDKNHKDYKKIQAKEERFKYLYSLFLYLQKEGENHGYHLNCGIYYKANCKISITKFSRKKENKK